MIDLMEMSYEEIFQEMEPIVKRNLRLEGKKLRNFKMVDRDQAYLRVLALDENYDLWKLTFVFNTTGDWPVHPLQCTARLKEIYELTNLRTSNLEMYGVTSAERIKFFEELKDFTQNP